MARGLTRWQALLQPICYAIGEAARDLITPPGCSWVSHEELSDECVEGVVLGYRVYDGMVLLFWPRWWRRCRHRNHFMRCRDAAGMSVLLEVVV